MAFKTLLSTRCLSNSAALMATMASRQKSLQPIAYQRNVRINLFYFKEEFFFNYEVQDIMKCIAL